MNMILWNRKPIKIIARWGVLCVCRRKGPHGTECTVLEVSPSVVIYCKLKHTGDPFGHTLD